ncbi:hypothetical protein [Pandoraea anhela]|uniref:Uncharacterized protein n=1 Tax=Pandoraea anhela TaxID=2508295 RepID=A0A5E4R9Q3_9BURK|nr:hypothetical protein [Pandoraea anhela]VVD59960.1 hypothetical protein PAN31108_00055 [Pandoraea anhela]
MAAMLSFSYKGFRIVCTAVPAPDGRWRGMAEVLKIADGILRDHRLSQMGGTIQHDERAALDTATELAKAWVDDR